MKKVLSFVLAAVMVLGLVNIGLAEDPVTVTFWNGWTGSDGDVLIEMVDEFNRTNPYNIHVEMDINADFQTTPTSRPRSPLPSPPTKARP